MDREQSKQPRLLKTDINRSGRRSIRSEVVFGTPSSGCQGVGICRVVMAGTEVPCKCPSVATLISQNEEGKICMKFSKRSMERRFMRRHFNWFLFQVLEPYELPVEISLKLGLNESEKVIAPGIYTVWESEEWLIVVF